MNILHVIASLSGGGTEKALTLFLENCSDRFTHYVCCINKTGIYEENLKKMGIKTFVLKRKCKFDLSLIKQIRKIISENDIDIIQTYNFTGNLWGRLAGMKFKNIPKIAFERGTIWRSNTSKVLIEKLLAKNTDLILANSHSAKIMLTYKTKLPSKMMKVIYGGMNEIKVLTDNEKDKMKDEVEIENYSYILGYIGRFVFLKGAEIIIDALEILIKKGYNLCLIFTGEGILNDHYKKLIKQKGLDKHFKIIGFRKDIQKVMQIFDILIQPSIMDCMPNSLIEGQLCKLPIIASNNDGISEIIEDGKTGILIEPEIPVHGKEYPKYHVSGKEQKPVKTKKISHIKLAEKIEELLKDKKKRQELAENAYLSAKDRFSIQRYVEELENIYSEVYNNKSKTI